MTPQTKKENQGGKPPATAKPAAATAQKPKPPAKKAVAKTVPEKKAVAKPAAKSAGNRLDPESVIKIGKGFDASKFKGSRGDRARLLKDSMTVADFAAAIVKAKVSGTAVGILGVLVEKGLVSLVTK